LAQTRIHDHHDHRLRDRRRRVLCDCGHTSRTELLGYYRRTPTLLKRKPPFGGSLLIDRSHRILETTCARPPRNPTAEKSLWISATTTFGSAEVCAAGSGQVLIEDRCRIGPRSRASGVVQRRIRRLSCATADPH